MKPTTIYKKYFQKEIVIERKIISDKEYIISADIVPN